MNTQEAQLRVLCLTMNPSVDLATETERVVPTHKLRCGDTLHDAGGGGINGARVLARLCRERGARLVLDTSGPALAAALAEGVYLFKPNLRELAELSGEALEAPEQWLGAARQLIQRGMTEIVALTLGHLGALLVTRDASWRAAPLDIPVASAVGAGDSFVGGMVAALQQRQPMQEAFALGVAAGSATLLSIGTGLCSPEDVQRLLPQVQIQPAD